MRGWTSAVAQTFRALVRRPGYSFMAVGILAVGIGAATSVFTLAEALLFRPLPLPEADRLVRVYSTNPMQERGWYSVSIPDFRDWTSSEHFSSASVYATGTRDLSGEGDPERVQFAAVHHGFFETLGTTPLIGRVLGPGDQRADAPPTVVLSEALWTRRLGASPDAIGATLRIDGDPYTVVGVVRGRESWPAGVDIWTPLRWGSSPPSWADTRSNHAWQVVGRLNDDVRIATASNRVREVARSVYAGPDIDPRDEGTEGVVVPLHSSEGGDGAGSLFLTLGAVVFAVLLLACLNASGLLLTRAWSRSRELSLRAALGASRLRLAAALFSETLVLALVGGALGLAIGVVGMRRAFELTPPSIRQLGDIALNPLVVLGALAISLVAALMAGAVPALRSSRISLASALHDGDHGGSRGKGGTRIRRAIVVGEVAVSLTLLVSASAAARGFQRQLTADPGFAAEEFLSFTVRLPEARYGDDALVDAYLTQAVERLAGLGSVVGATTTSRLPLDAGGLSLLRNFVKDPADPDHDGFNALWVEVDAGYFEALGIPVLEGRDFASDAATDGPLVAVVSRSMADLMAPAGTLVGETIRSQYDENLPRTVVGVVDDLQFQGVSRARMQPFVLVPRTQSTRRSMAFMVRTTSDPQTAIPDVRRAMTALDPDVALDGLQPIRDAHATDLAGIRFLTTLFVVFGTVALVLAVTGIYGLVSISVTQRTREIGVRMAMGATTHTVRNAVMLESAWLAGLGLILGLGLSYAAIRVLMQGMSGIATMEWSTAAGVALLLATGVLLGTWIPARRATRIDPAGALRAD